MTSRRVSAALFGAVAAIAFSSMSYAASSQSTASDQAYTWLKTRMTSTGLVSGYDEARDLCRTYDQAIAVIAFVVKGDTPRAARILDTLQTVQHPDGSWNSAYACTDATTQENQKHVGPVVWVALAVAHYERKTGDTTTYRRMALRALNWAMQFQELDGGINGGLDADGVVLSWAAAQDNQNMYTTLVYFGFWEPAQVVKSFVDTELWDESAQRLRAGRGNPGDAPGAEMPSVAALSIDVVRGHVESLDVDPTPGIYADASDVEFEHRAHTALALKLVGRDAEADRVIDETIQAREARAAVSSRDSSTQPDKTSNSASASAVGWLLLAIHRVNPFETHPVTQSRPQRFWPTRMGAIQRR